MKSPGNRTRYGRRGSLGGADAGIRRVAPTFGNVLHLTSSGKAGGRIAVNSDAERLISQMMTIDPSITTFAPQPFTVDLVDKRVLRTPEEVTDARQRHRGRQARRKFYTPDFSYQRGMQSRFALEVKLEGFEGGPEYDEVLLLAKEILESAAYQFQCAVVPADPRHPIRTNVALLKQAASRADLFPDPGLLDRIAELCAGGPVVLSDLCEQSGLSPSMVPVMLICGAVSASLSTERICGLMLLEAAGGDQSHLQLIGELIR